MMQISINNSVGGGTGLPGSGGGGRPFENSYSLSFDGMDDKVELGTQSLGITGAISVSAWVKIPTTNTGGASPYIQQIVCEDRAGGTNRNWNLGWRGGGLNQINAVLFDSLGTAVVATSTAIVPNDGNWHHLMFTYTGDTSVDGLKLFIDGIQRAQATSANGGLRSTTAIVPTIGGLSQAITWMFEGNIDEVAIFNTDQSSNIATLSTAPTVDLTSLNPLAWYRNGDNGSWKSPQWLIPNNENKDKVSNYSMAFDGVGDKIDIGTALDLGVNSTLSFWIKRGRISTSEVWFGEDSYSSDYLVTITSSTVLYFRINTSYVGWNYAAVKSILNNTTEWVNVCIVRSGNSVELFLNGISYGTGNSNAGTPGATVTRFDTIAASPYGLHTFAQFDEIAAWNNNTVNPVDIYNGGTPTTITGAIAHYKMGEDSTFLTNWTVPDAVGSNDGTSANMTIEDRIGEAPNSTSNAVSFNMDEVDRTTDVPT